MISKVNLTEQAKALGDGWRAAIVSDFGPLRVKLFAIDPKGLPEEQHDGWAEALLMIHGHCTLMAGNDFLSLGPGDYVNIAKGCRNAILPGGSGALLLIDPEPSPVPS